MVLNIKKGKNITGATKKTAADLMRATSSAFVPGRFLTEAATSKTGRTKTCYYYTLTLTMEKRHNNVTLYSS